MKKITPVIICIVYVIVMVLVMIKGCTPAHAGTEVREIGSPIQGSREGVMYVRPFCKFGMQFITVVVEKTNNSNGSGGVATIQVMAPTGGNLNLYPLKCQEDSREPTVWK